MNQSLNSPHYRRYFLAVFVAMTAFAYTDRVLMSTLGQAIKTDLDLSDTQLGMLGGLAIAVFYAIFAIPSARLAEKYRRAPLVSIAVTIWAVMTTLCGMAQNFGQLLMARIGVGIGESGALATQSLVSDMFPPNKRASALGILNLGVTIGIVFGAVASGLIVQKFGWRPAFFLLGFPGVFIALLIFFTIKEPPRGYSDPASVLAGDAAPPFRAVLKIAFSKRCFVHVLIGATLVVTVGSGLSQFMHPFFVRRFHLGYAEAAMLFGMINGITTGIGFVAGGFLSDWLARHDKRYYGIVPACGLLIAGPLFALGFFQTTWEAAAPLLAIPGMFSSTYFAPTYAVAHNIVQPRMRASITAILSLGSSLTALAIGPTLAGFISDKAASLHFGAGFAQQCPGGHAVVGAAAFAVHHCADATALGTRDALAVFSLAMLWAALHYYLASRTMQAELA